MIIVDTNILSTFLKIGKVELLYSVFNTDKLYVSANVFRELWNASETGYAYVKPLFDLIKDKKIEVVTPTEKELLRTLELPKSFGSGELDSLVICQARNAVFLSNEKRVMNYCIKNKITCFDLTDILAALWKFEIMNQAEVRKLILEIEEKDNVHVTSKDEIFK